MTLLIDITQYCSRNWALISIPASILVLLLIPFLVVRKYVRISLNIFTDTEPPLSMSQVRHPRVSGEEVDFWSADGLRLRGLFLHPPPDVASKGLVLFAPEFKSDRHSCSRYCLPLLRAGYDVFSFDFRGHGHSTSEPGYIPRQWPSDRELSDMRGAVAYVRDWLAQQQRPPEIGMFGISRGAGVALLAAARDPLVKCFVTDGVFSSDAALEHLMKRWAYIFATVRFVYENHPPEFWMFLRWCMVCRAERKFDCRFPSVRKAVRGMLPRPILFVHGAKDSYIPVEQSRVLYAQAPQPRYLWVVPGARHNQCVDVQPAEYARRTVDFFDRFLSGECRQDNIYQRGMFADWTQPLAGSSAEADAGEDSGPIATAARAPRSTGRPSRRRRDRART